MTASCHNTVLIEAIQPYRTAPGARVALFDFDGTLSLIRSGWMEIMLDMMMESLAPLALDRQAAYDAAEQYVARLTGQDTLFQMAAFTEHVRELGGAPGSAEDYKAQFLERLQEVRNARLHSLQTGIRSQESLLVPGSFDILSRLRTLGLTLYLSSGTDHDAVLMEAELLGLLDYFGMNVFGAGPGGSTKPDLLQRIVQDGIPASQIIFFGDGQVEIAATRAIGGLAAGMATDEPECIQVNPKKRQWLIGAGADFILPNYLDPEIFESLSREKSAE